MDEIIIRIMRAIASLPRLRLLDCLARTKEMTPSALSDKLDVPLNALCTDLKLLMSAGLISRHKSGTWCYYAARSPYNEQALSGSLMKWLRGVLTAPTSTQTMKNRGPQEGRDSSGSSAGREVHAVIFEAATAFTDLRRLQILRRLARQGPGTTQKLTEELSMSEDAVSRHMVKLRRRGYVVSERSGRRVTHQLAGTAKTPIHADLFRIVRREWDKQESRTS